MRNRKNIAQKIKTLLIKLKEKNFIKDYVVAKDNIYFYATIENDTARNILHKMFYDINPKNWKSSHEQSNVVKVYDQSNNVFFYKVDSWIKYYSLNEAYENLNIKSFLKNYLKEAK